MNQAGAQDVSGITHLPLSLKARLTVPSDPVAEDPETVDLDWWVLHPAAYVDQPMTNLSNVFTAQLNDRPWMGGSTIAENGNELEIIFSGTERLCFSHHNRMLIGLRATDLSIAGDGRHPAEVYVTLEQSRDRNESDVSVTLFESTFTLAFERQFFVVGLISFCENDMGEITLDFTGFQGNGFIDFNPGDP